MQVSRRVQLWALLVLINFLWAVQYPAYRVVSATVSAASLSFWMFLIAVAVLLPALFCEQRVRRQFRWAKLLRVAADFFVLAAIGLIPPTVVVAWGIAHSSASNASILGLTIPVLMVIMGVIILKERPGATVSTSLLLALAGATIMSWNDFPAGNFAGSRLSGNVAVFLGGVGTAFYSAFSKKLLGRHSPAEVSVYGYVFAALLCAIMSLVSDVTPFYQTSSWPPTAWLGIAVLGLTCGVAVLLWLWALESLALVQLSVSVYISTILSLLISAQMLGERLGPMQIAGCGVVLLSAYLSPTMPAKRSPWVRSTALAHPLPPNADGSTGTDRPQNR